MSDLPQRPAAAAGAPLSRVLDLLACPACHRPLHPSNDTLACTGCRRSFPATDGIPVLLIDRASAGPDHR